MVGGVADLFCEKLVFDDLGHMGVSTHVLKFMGTGKLKFLLNC